MTATSTSTGTVIPLIVALIAAIATVIAAVLAAWSARSARRSDAQAAHARDLESRLADKKYQTYEPMINLLRDIQDAEKATKALEDGSAK